MNTPRLDQLNIIHTYISMSRNDIQHAVCQTSLNLLQIPSNGIKNSVNILLCNNASMKQHLHTDRQAVLRAKCCIAAATYWIKLRISTACWIFTIPYNRPRDAPPRKIVPSPGGPGPHLMHGSLGSPSPYSKWHLNWLRRFCDQQPERDTRRPCYISNNRPHFMLCNVA